jgi:hypothetical protein
MGQRFQIILENEGVIKVYHFQWLWGYHAIRRIGKALYYYLKQPNYLDFVDYLKMSCYSKPNDINIFSEYYERTNDFYDNKEICNDMSKKTFKRFLKDLCNNDGFFYLSISNKEILGYCFIGNDLTDIKPLSAIEYLKTKNWYGKEINDDNWRKTQIKWIEKGLKTFDKLKVIEPIKIIYKEEK